MPEIYSQPAESESCTESPCQRLGPSSEIALATTCTSVLPEPELFVGYRDIGPSGSCEVVAQLLYFPGQCYNGVAISCLGGDTTGYVGSVSCVNDTVIDPFAGAPVAAPAVCQPLSRRAFGCGTLPAVPSLSVQVTRVYQGETCGGVAKLVTIRADNVINCEASDRCRQTNGYSYITTCELSAPEINASAFPVDLLTYDIGTLCDNEPNSRLYTQKDECLPLIPTIGGGITAPLFMKWECSSNGGVFSRFQDSSCRDGIGEAIPGGCSIAGVTSLRCDTGVQLGLSLVLLIVALVASAVL